MTTTVPVQRRLVRASAPLALLIGLLPPCASGSGLYIPLKGAQATGFASVGTGSAARDGSTIFYNPAGMTLLGEAFLEVGADLIAADIRVSDRGSQVSTPGTLGQPLPVVGGAGHSEDPTPVGTLFLGIPLGDGRWWLGLGLTTPFGLALNYSPDWFGRYDSYDNQFETLNLGPVLAYRVNDAWSMGGGIDFQYGDASLSAALPNPLQPGGPSPATDGRSQLSGDGWATGFNLGLLYHPKVGTRLGLHYRSRISHDLKGAVTVSGLQGPLAGANGRSAGEAALELPDILTLSLTQALTPDLTLLGEVKWFGWEVYEEIRVKFQNGAPDLVRPQGFENTFTLGLAAEYRLADRWTLRGGLEYDQSPTTDALRNTSVPDSDLIWIGLGASYHVSERLRLDLGMIRGVYERADIDLSVPVFVGTPLASQVQVRGETDSHVDTLSLSLSYRFGG